MDPLAEKTMTPYQYVANNPIMFTDPTGMSKQGGGDPTDPSTGIPETTLEELVINVDRRSFTTKVMDQVGNTFGSAISRVVDDFNREALAMVPGNSSGEYGMNQRPFDAISISASFDINTGIFNASGSIRLAYTHGEAALVFGGNYGLGNNGTPYGAGGGITLNGHNNFGNNTDVLEGLGGLDLTYSAGYGVMGTYGVSARPVGNKTVHAQSGVETYGIGLGTGASVT